ncbi:MAG: head maturation protease, ClpP-related [Actinomycetota bacterium]
MNLAEIEARNTARTEKLRAFAPDARAEAPPVVLDGTTARIRMYQSIDDWGEFWGLSANELVDTLDSLPSNIDTIELAINSPGGFVFESIAMVNALRRHSAKVVAVVDGIAASAASFIAAAADECWMMPNTMLMLHAPWGVIRGNSKDMREYADVLDDITMNMAEIYAAKTGDTADEWLDKLTAGDDMYFSTESAIEAGLADGVIEPPGDDETEDDDANASTQTADVTASTSDENEAQRFDPSHSMALLNI